MSNRLENQNEPDRFSDYEAGGRPLNGWKVLAMIVGFFLVVGVVDGLMIYKALGTFSGEVTPHPYERGLAYNKDIAQARAQAAREWKVDVTLSRIAPGESEIRVVARDAAGANVTGAEMTALFAAPADLAKDVRVKLGETAPGRYAAAVKLPKGQRDLVLTAARDGREVFRSKSRINME
ncbi:MAG: FixH family protein [Methylocystis sp.]|uniref:FixH family protein n=1 Tax=Methylocystis sp. TaxID=1911079 RepID=UPI003DA596BD